MGREFYIPEVSKAQSGVLQCYGLPGGAALVATNPTSLLVLENQATPVQRCSLPAAMVGRCHVYGDNLVSFVSKIWDETSGKQTEETWFLFDFRKGTVVSRMRRQPAPWPRDRLFLGDRWLCAGRQDDRLFHFVSADGAMLSSIVPVETADLAPVDGVLGHTDSGSYDGELGTLDERTYLYVFHYRPLILAFQETGKVLWSAVVSGLVSGPELKQRRRPRLEKESEIWLIPVNDFYAVGAGIAVLHRWSGHRVSIWSPRGERLGDREIGSNVVGFWWNGSHLTVARAGEGRLVIEDVDVPGV